MAFGVTALASMLYLIPRTRRLRWDAIAQRLGRARRAVHQPHLDHRQPLGPADLGRVVDVGRAPHHHRAHARDLPRLPRATIGRGQPVDPGDCGRRSSVSWPWSSCPINHMAVEWWRTLHQGRSLASLDPGTTLDGDFIAAMLLGFFAMTLTYRALLLMRTQRHRIRGGGSRAERARRRNRGPPPRGGDARMSGYVIACYCGDDRFARGVRGVGRSPSTAPSTEREPKLVKRGRAAVFLGVAFLLAGGLLWKGLTNATVYFKTVDEAVAAARPAGGSALPARRHRASPVRSRAPTMASTSS